MLHVSQPSHRGVYPKANLSAATANAGCGGTDASDQSYGTTFNKNGGGAFATLWDDQGIRIFFFPRQSIPSDVHSDAPDPSGWGKPAIAYDKSGCDFDKYFKPQTIIFEYVLFRFTPDQIDMFWPLA